MLLADINLGDVIWSMIIFFFFIIFLWMIFVYLIVRGHGMSGRMAKSQAEAQAQFDDYVRQTAGTSSAAGEITSAKALLDSGAISQDEFERIKQQALAAS